jgi:hypothetical protein
MDGPERDSESAPARQFSLTVTTVTTVLSESLGLRLGRRVRLGSTILSRN